MKQKWLRNRYAKRAGGKPVKIDIEKRKILDKVSRIKYKGRKKHDR